MNDPVCDLNAGCPLDDLMRKRITRYYKSRGKKALEIIDQRRVKRYLDFFVVVGDSDEYAIEDTYCSCDDFLHRGGLCSHIIAVKIAEASGFYEKIDLWYYEDIKESKF